jgi:starvation-inducible DNA-binding protein
MKTNTAKGLAHLLGDLVQAKMTLQGYHWNVIGRDFNEFHEFFGEIYEHYESAIDPVAENILKLGDEAPYMLVDFHELSCCNEPRIVGGSVDMMLESAFRLNGTLIACTKEAFEIAESEREVGVSDYLAGLLDQSMKFQWKLRSALGVR